MLWRTRRNVPTLSEADMLATMTLKFQHSGWQGELLAAHLLSRFSFIARPLSISDDQGADFYCTIYQIVTPTSGQPQLEPRTSFAIQVKTTHKNADTSALSVTKHIAYLQQLNNPFFIGHVTLGDARMDIYSAEFLPLALAKTGLPTALTLVPTKEPVSQSGAWDGPPEDLRLWCPFVATMSIEEEQSVANAAHRIETICRRTLINIASRLTHHHVYDFNETLPVLMAGPGPLSTTERTFVNNSLKSSAI